MIFMPGIGFAHFGGFNFIFIMFFLAIFGLIIGLIFKSIYNSFVLTRANNSAPVLIVPAAITGKRTAVTGSHTAAGYNHPHHHHHTRTDYFITFEVESGDRIEFRVSQDHFALLAEDDTGKLTFQGTRFLSFERNRGN